jgi:hypothetical protein
MSKLGKISNIQEVFLMLKARSLRLKNTLQPMMLGFYIDKIKRKILFSKYLQAGLVNGKSSMR